MERLTPQVAGRDPEELAREIVLAQAYRHRAVDRAHGARYLSYYTKLTCPWFVIEECHLLMDGYLEALAEQRIDRLMIFMQPRAGKSEKASVIYPSWYIGKFPRRELMQAGHSDDLSRGFGRKAKMLVGSVEFQDVFPGVILAPDSKAAGRWNTNVGGGYLATGLTGGISGKGFHHGTIDDPLSEQNARSRVAQARAQAWYPAGFYTRQAAEGASILYMGTRWDKNDLAGWLLRRPDDDPHADEWTVLRIPSLIDEGTAELLNEVAEDRMLTKRFNKPRRFQKGDSFSPRRWTLDRLMRIKGNLSDLDWEALYQQNPTVAEGAIIKRSYWRKWPHATPPKCIFVMQVYDTAFEEKEANDYSARTTWGIFRTEDYQPQDGERLTLQPYSAILLDRFNKRVDFPALRTEARASYRYHRPDRVLVEKKASGHSLIQELRRNGVPVRGVKAERSKTARASAAAIVGEQGCVYYMNREWAKEVIDQCADFPNGEFDDLTDTVVIAWLFLRRLHHLEFASELEDDEDEDMDLMQRVVVGV